MIALKIQWFIDLLFNEIKGYIEYQGQKERGAYMKTKQQILKAIECCSKMGTMREQDCCSRCPYKREGLCYKQLISDLKWYVVNDVSAFVNYLENNPDGSIKNFEDTETLFEYVEIGHLGEKEFDFTCRGDIQ